MLNDFKYLAFLTTFLYSKVQMNTRLFLRICLNSYGTRRQAALAYLGHRLLLLLLEEENLNYSKYVSSLSLFVVENKSVHQTCSLRWFFSLTASFNTRLPSARPRTLWFSRSSAPALFRPLTRSPVRPPDRLSSTSVTDQLFDGPRSLLRPIGWSVSCKP